MDPSKSIVTALRFNEKINQQDPDGLAELMTEDHTFIDNNGRVTGGKDSMREGWRNFFERYPDYRTTITSVTIQNGIVAIVGHSACSDKQLEGPNIWTAKTRGGLISEWRVYWLDKR